MKYILKVDTDACDTEASVKSIYLISQTNNIIIPFGTLPAHTILLRLKNLQKRLANPESEICVYNGLYDFQMLVRIFSAFELPELIVNARIIDIYRQLYLQDKCAYKFDILYTRLTNTKVPANSFEIQNRLKMLNDIYNIKFNFRKFAPEEYFI